MDREDILDAVYDAARGAGLDTTDPRVEAMARNVACSWLLEQQNEREESDSCLEQFAALIGRGVTPKAAAITVRQRRAADEGLVPKMKRSLALTRAKAAVERGDWDTADRIVTEAYRGRR